ncbi:MAG: transposase [Coriobacteriia bacterium]|nr:transposase [Coriobacteriia bacterium]
MPGRNNKYTPEFRESTSKHIIESGKSVPTVANDLGINKGLLYKWVQDYRRDNNLPTWAEQQGIKPMRKKSESDLLYEKKELERELKRQKKENEDHKETIEILKKSLSIFAQPTK